MSRSRLRRILVILGRILAAVVGIVVLVLLLLLLPPVRGRVLEFALPRVTGALPGEVTVGSARWPGPGHIELADVLWTADGDTLLSLARTDVDVALRPLLSGDLHLHTLDLGELRADWPALQAHILQAADSTASVGSGSGFPRVGAIAAVPSVAIDRLAITAPSLRVTASMPPLAARLRGNLDVLAGHDPAVTIDTLRVLATPTPQWPLVLHASTPQPGQVHLAVARRDAAAPVERDPGLDVVVTLQGDPAVPVHLGVRADVRTPNLGERPGVRASLQGAVTLDRHAVVLDSLAIRSSDLDVWLRGRYAADETDTPLTATLAVDARGYRLAAGFAYSPGDTTLRSTPLVVLPAGADPRQAQGAERSGQVTRHGDGAIAARDLRVRGAAGDINLSGRYAPDGTSHLDLTTRWPAPPELLLALLPLEPAQRDTLRAVWPADTPTLQVQADATRRGERTQARAHARFVLPGPVTLGRAFGAKTPSHAGGPLRGTLDVDGAVGGGDPAVHAFLDLAGTPWLAEGKLAANWQPRGVTIDSARFTGDGLSLTARGGLRDESCDLRGNLHVVWPDAQTWLPDVGYDDTRADVTADLTVGGALHAPVVEATLHGNVAATDLALPELTGTLRYGDDGLAAHLRAPQGVGVGTVHLDSITVGATTAGRATMMPVDLSIDAVSADLAWSQRARLRTGDALTLRTDSLAVRAGKLALHATQPFTVAQAAGRRGVTIADLDLAGSGQVTVDGYVSRDSLDLAANLALDLPEEPSLIARPMLLWPRHLDARIDAQSWRDVQAQVTATGLELGRSEDLDARLAITGTPDSTHVTLRLGDDAQALAAGDARLPALSTLLNAGAEHASLPLQGRLTLTRCPLPRALLQLPPDPTAPDPTLAGSVAMTGTAAAPSLDADITLGFPDWPKLASFTARFLGRVRPAGTDSSGVTARLTLDGLQRHLLSAAFAWPGELSLAPVQWQPGDGGVDGRITSEDIPLANFDSLLPASTSLGGTCRMELSATGPTNAAELDGRLTLNGARIALADGNRVTGSGKLDLGGTTADPHIRGDITITQGVIRIPEAQRDLLPASGTSMLWEIQDSSAVDTTGTDSSGVAMPARPRPPADVATLPGGVDVTVRIPSGLLLRGRGLEVELAGQLHVQRQEGMPTVVGQLETVRGSLRYLGRIFKVDRGIVGFYGDDTLDPTLDISLSTTVGSYQITIQFTGTALKPRLALSSTPSLEQGDIIAVLVFGEPLDQLDTDQMNLVRRRTTDLLAIYGSSLLDSSVGQQLGVDMITVAEGRNENEGSALVVAKYLSPKVLLKYEQALSDWTMFFITLEYRFFGDFNLQTIVGRNGESGAELNWSHDY